MTAGFWGGSCTCPDGVKLQVGDNLDYCGSLACEGGTPGPCMRYGGPWSRRRGTCRPQQPQWMEPPGGRSRGVCLTDGRADSIIAWSISEDDCKRQCAESNSCHGYQFNRLRSHSHANRIRYRCDMMTTRITGVRPVNGALCYVKVDIYGLQTPTLVVAPTLHPRTQEWDNVLATPRAKIYSMFAAHGWLTRRDGRESCWGSTPLAFFDDAFHGERCQSTDWHDKVFDQWRPRLSPPSRALLGFEDSLSDFCKRRSPSGWRGEHASTVGYGERAFVHTCVEARLNVLRMMGGSWNMCENLRWVMCAANGKLRGQAEGRGVLTFANAPKDVEPHKHVWHNQMGHEYSPDDVFYAEVALLSMACSNHDALWALSAGDDFSCELDRVDYDHLATMLIEWDGF